MQGTIDPHAFIYILDHYLPIHPHLYLPFSPLLGHICLKELCKWRAVHRPGGVGGRGWRDGSTINDHEKSPPSAESET